jgi:hypothetical protein
MNCHQKLAFWRFPSLFAYVFTFLLSLILLTSSHLFHIFFFNLFTSATVVWGINLFSVLVQLS